MRLPSSSPAMHDGCMTSVAIVDDDLSVRRAARALIEPVSRFHLSSEADSVATASALLRDAHPDIVLLDLGLSDGSGIDVLRGLHASKRPIAIVLTVFEDDAHIFEALRAGASGYLLKHDLDRKLVPALDEAVAGGAPMSPMIARRVLASFAPPAASPPNEQVLTAREREVTELLAHGSTYDEVARMLGISANTVRSFIRSIYEKLHVSSKTEAVREAMRLGILSKP